MNPNAVRGAVAALFLVAVIGAYLIGKSAGERQASASLAKGSGSHVGGSSGGSSLTGLGPGIARPGDETAGDPAARKASIKSIIAKARAKMQGGMMNTSGMMRALALLEEIPDAEIVAALEEVERSIKEPQQKMMFAMLLLGRWAESDGPAAMAYADEHFSSKNPMMAGIRMSLVASWAQSDPEAAWDWYQEEEDDARGGMFGGKSMALMGIIGSMASKDVDAAFERMTSIEDPQERAMAMQGFGQAIWDEDKREVIMAKIDSIEDAEEKQQMRTTVLTQWSQIDPESALEWAAKLDESERSPAVKQIAQAMVWSDPQRAGDLLLSEAKTEQERTQAYATTISSWAYSDANGAGEWLGNQEQGPELDQARQQFAMSIAQKDPVSAMAWADAVTEENTRISAIQNVYTQWAGKDREQADAALDDLDLSDAKVTELKQMELPKVTNMFNAYGGAVSTSSIHVESDLTVPAVETVEEAE